MLSYGQQNCRIGSFLSFPRQNYGSHGGLVRPTEFPKGWALSRARRSFSMKCTSVAASDFLLRNQSSRPMSAMTFYRFRTQLLKYLHISAPG